MNRIKRAFLPVLMLALAGGGVAAHAASASSGPVKATATPCTTSIDPTFVGHSTSSQNLTSGTLTVLAMSMDCDTYDAWGAPNNKYISPSGAYYLVTGEACFDSNSDSTRRLLEFRVNGSGGATYGASQSPALSSPSYSTCMDITTLVHLAANDFVQLVGTQGSGSTLGVTQARMTLTILGCDTGC